MKGQIRRLVSCFSFSFVVAVVDFMLFLAITSSNFSSGVILVAYGFLPCFLLMLTISVISMLVCIFFLGESLPAENRADKNFSFVKIFTLPKEIWKILEKDRPSKWRLKLLIPLDATVGFTAPVTVLQVLVLILLNIPFCWPSNWIGYYRGTLFVIMGVGGVLAVKVLPLFINKSVVIMMANISSAAYLVLFALARDKLWAYLCTCFLLEYLVHFISICILEAYCSCLRDLKIIKFLLKICHSPGTPLFCTNLWKLKSGNDKAGVQFKLLSAQILLQLRGNSHSLLSLSLQLICKS